jgi:hypothetical protein
MNSRLLSENKHETVSQGFSEPSEASAEDYGGPKRLLVRKDRAGATVSSRLSRSSTNRMSAALDLPTLFSTSPSSSLLFVEGCAFDFVR